MHLRKKALFHNMRVTFGICHQDIYQFLHSLMPYNECSSSSTFRVERNVEKYRRILLFSRNGEDTIIQREFNFFWHIFFVVMEEVDDRLNKKKDKFF